MSFDKTEFSLPSSDELKVSRNFAEELQGQLPSLHHGKSLHGASDSSAVALSSHLNFEDNDPLMRAMFGAKGSAKAADHASSHRHSPSDSHEVGHEFTPAEQKAIRDALILLDKDRKKTPLEQEDDKWLKERHQWIAREHAKHPNKSKKELAEEYDDNSRGEYATHPARPGNLMTPTEVVAWFKKMGAKIEESDSRDA